MVETRKGVLEGLPQLPSGSQWSLGEDGKVVIEGLLQLVSTDKINYGRIYPREIFEREFKKGK